MRFEQSSEELETAPRASSGGLRHPHVKRPGGAEEPDKLSLEGQTPVPPGQWLTYKSKSENDTHELALRTEKPALLGKTFLVLEAHWSVQCLPIKSWLWRVVAAGKVSSRQFLFLINFEGVFVIFPPWFFKKFLFIWDRAWERVVVGGGGREREKQAVRWAGSPMGGWHPWDQDLRWSQELNWLTLPGTPPVAKFLTAKRTAALEFFFYQFVE